MILIHLADKCDMKKSFNMKSRKHFSLFVFAVALPTLTAQTGLGDELPPPVPPPQQMQYQAKPSDPNSYSNSGYGSFQDPIPTDSNQEGRAGNIQHGNGNQIPQPTQTNQQPADMGQPNQAVKTGSEGPEPTMIFSEEGGSGEMAKGQNGESKSKQDDPGTLLLQKISSGGKGFLNVNGEVILLKHSKVIEIHELIPIEKKYWVVVLSPNPIPAKFTDGMEDPRRSLAQLKQYLYIELRPGRQEIAFYQIQHPSIKTPIMAQDVPSGNFEMNYGITARDVAGTIGMKSYSGEKEQRHLFKFHFRSTPKVVHLKSFLPNGEAPLGPQVLEQAMGALPEAIDSRAPAGGQTQAPVQAPGKTNSPSPTHK